MDNIQDIVEEFNSYFVGVGSNLASKIPACDDKLNVFDHLIKDNSNSMFLCGINKSDILEIVRKMKNKTSTDIYSIDMVIIKEVIDVIVGPLTYICNLSFQKGIFPNNMKTAKVIPIFKNGDRHCFDNYRPVSLLPQFSKILENLFAKQLDLFLDKYELLSEHQYGFRGNRTTTYAVMEMVEEVTKAIENDEFSVGIYIDLQKAFDTIDHRILLRKLEKYGLRGIAYSWVKSYLENRQQCVRINNTVSQFKVVTCGVPQGSVIGPKLF